tara:strand:- start:36 stop:560 length:525 start_codon:yes stop_codon:yes gene_type:complete
MKHLVKLVVVTLITLFCTYTIAEEKVAFLDMKYILNNSKAGKEAQNFLKEKVKKSQAQFEKSENELKKIEKDLLSKKTILSKEEYKKKTDDLRKKVGDYQVKRNKIAENIGKIRAEAKQELLKNLDPILKEYMLEAGITLIINKKNVVVGNNNLDITNPIVKKLDTKLPSLNLK